MNLNQTVGEIVAADYRTAAVFSKYGIDFCCGGKMPIEQACRQHGVNPQTLLSEIEELRTASTDRAENYSAWSLPFLADYIVNTHHVYLKDNTAQIAAYARKIADVHGENHPELVEISATFDGVMAAMSGHLREEEEVLFPALKRIHESRTAGKAPAKKDLEILKQALENLDRDHNEIGDAVHRIRDLSKNYSVPADACNTYVVAFRKLNEFENDLHRHVHLENNIMFVKAAKEL